jgi:hypothetical protein
MRHVDDIACRKATFALLTAVIAMGAVGCGDGGESASGDDEASRNIAVIQPSESRSGRRSVTADQPSEPLASARPSGTAERSHEPMPSAPGAVGPTGQPGDPLPAPEGPPPVKKGVQRRDWVNGEKPPGTPPPPIITTRRDGQTVIVYYRVRWDDPARRAALIIVAVDGHGDDLPPVGDDFPVTARTGRVTVQIAEVMRGPYTVRAHVRNRRGFPGDAASIRLE